VQVNAPESGRQRNPLSGAEIEPIAAMTHSLFLVRLTAFFLGAALSGGSLTGELKNFHTA
jgi:hypothetical protein